MAKYRKKPVVIEAVRFIPDRPWPDGVRCKYRWYDSPFKRGGSGPWYIETLEGKMNVSAGDWIITGVNGEKYPCKPDIFDKTYERVEE